MKKNPLGPRQNSYKIKFASKTGLHTIEMKRYVYLAICQNARFHYYFVHKVILHFINSTNHAAPEKVQFLINSAELCLIQHTVYGI